LPTLRLWEDRVTKDEVHRRFCSVFARGLAKAIAEEKEDLARLKRIRIRLPGVLRN
jgi:hypothetical protein